MERDKSTKHQFSPAEMEACLQIFRDEPRQPDAGTTGASTARPEITEKTRRRWWRKRIAKKFKI
jgi:hypothetical protein